MELHVVLMVQIIMLMKPFLLELVNNLQSVVLMAQIKNMLVMEIIHLKITQVFVEIQQKTIYVVIPLHLLLIIILQVVYLQ